jgi:hypothetical protein
MELSFVIEGYETLDEVYDELRTAADELRAAGDQAEVDGDIDRTARVDRALGCLEAVLSGLRVTRGS